MSSGGSRLFGAGRALGLVSDETPLVVRYIRRRREHLVVTCVGRAFHTYSFTRLALLTTSPQHTQGKIGCLAADTYHVYTAVGSQMFAWRRGRELQHTYGEAGGGAEVRLMLPFGPHLVSVDSAGVLRVWDVKAEELYTELTFHPASFEVSAIAHPDTYINKVVLGSRQGSLQLWNLHKGKLVYTFSGWGSAVTVLQQAPALDVMAVGLQDGRIFLHNLKYDETITSFMQDWGCVTGVAFLTEPNSRPLMASASTSGHVVLWDLEERRVCSQLKAHAASVGGLVSLPGEPILITSSSDNSLKVWVLGEGQSVEEPPRLLRLREGHAAPPTFLRFHGADGKNLVTAGADSTLRIFSTVTETFNKSLGRASYNRKKSKKSRLGAEDPLTMPPVTQFSCESAREKEWDDIVALHLGLPTATTWSYDKLRMGQHKLLHDRFEKGSKYGGEVSACSVCLSRCGNFAVVGLSSGHVDRFNVQSGLHRDSYGDPTAHGGAVRGVHCHPLNRTVVTAGADAKLKLWPFNCRGGAPLRELDLGEPCLLLRSHCESGLVALALEDFSLCVVDVEACNVVRRLRGHGARPTDLAFSPDARWLVSAAMDCLILTWDLVSSTLVDCLQTEEACVSVSFSPGGDLLATAHVDSLGVFLWCNRALFSHVSLRPLDAATVTTTGSAAEPVVTSLPLTAPDDDDRHQGEATAASGGGHGDDDREDGERCRSPVQMPGGLVTLAGLASSRWQNLLSLDVIRRRNRPREAPRPAKAAPFFLPTVPSLGGDVRFNINTQQQDNNNTGEAGDRWRLPVSLTVFGQLLLDTPETEWQLLVTRLKELGPSALDLEVSSLSPEAGGSVELMARFLRLLSHVLRSGGDFELAQAHLALFLQRHGAILASHEALQAPLREASVLQARGWGRLQQRLMSATATVAFLRNT